ncbi:MAG: CHAP domain-containing protein [Eubacteriales bacterium]|nr:CHAP domain-containing protein [Eubacteriales bacterium]
MAKKKTLLIVPVILVITMLVSLMTPLYTYAQETQTASYSEEYQYQPRLTAPEYDNPYYYSSMNYYYRTGYGMPNCVAYALGRLYELNGEEPKLNHGNASEWYGMNIRNGYYDYGQTPKEGAIACWSHHVAVVERINADGSVTYSESRWRAERFVVVTYGSPHGHNYSRFLGYIYAYDEDKARAHAAEAKREALSREIANHEAEKNTCYKQDKIVNPGNDNAFTIAKQMGEKIEASRTLNLLTDKLQSNI